MIAEVQNQNTLEEIIAEIATSTKVARRIVRKTAIPQRIETVGQTANSAQTTATNAQTTANEAKQAAQDAGGINNDNIAPAVPAAPSVSVFERNLSISWTPAPVGEYVVKTRIRMTPAGGTAITKTTTDTYYIATKLEVNVVHDIEVQFEDRWGLTSGWSPATQATPQPTIADQLAADVQVEATRISGLLGEDKIAQITSPSKLAEAVYSTAVERGGRGANLLPFDRAEAAAYAVGLWPQKGYGTITGNRDISIVAHMEDQWWQSVTDAADSVGLATRLHSAYEDRGLGGDAYVFSAMVKNIGTADASVSIGVEQASDTAGTGTGAIVGSAVTIPPDNKIYRVFVRFTNDKARPFKRFYHSNRLVSSTILINKFQLEEVTSSQLGPGRYTMPVMNAGALTARLLAAWDLTAVRAMIGDLTVESAKIVNGAIVTAKIGDAQITTAKILDANITTAKILDGNITTAKIGDAQITSAKISSIVADKITSGTIAAQTITLGTGGVIKAGTGTNIDAEGVKLQVQGSYNTKSYTSTNKISSVLESAALMFYSNADTAADGAFRGAILRADGEPITSTSRVGAVVLHATQAGTINTQAGRVEVLAVKGTTDMGRVNLYEDVNINRDLAVARNVSIGGMVSGNSFDPQSKLASTAIASATSLTVTHSLGVYPAVIMAYLFNGVATSNPNGITPLPTPDGNMYVWDNTTTAFKIWNGFSGSRNTIARIYK